MAILDLAPAQCGEQSVDFLILREPLLGTQRTYADGSGLIPTTCALRLAVERFGYQFDGENTKCLTYGRQNHLIGRVLQDAERAPALEQQIVFHGITGYLVFTTMSNDDTPISSLDQKPGSNERFFLRPSIKALIYLPVLTIAFIVLTDIVSWVMPPTIRDAGSDPDQSLFFYLYHNRQPRFWQLMGMELFAVVFGTATYFLCKYVLTFEKATAYILKEFEAKYVPFRKAEPGEDQIASGTNS